MIWTFSLPGACSIRVRPTVPKDGLLPLLSDRYKPRRVLVKFSYEDNNPIAALRTSRESRKAALSVYQYCIENGIYFCPDRDTLLFTGLEAMFRTLVLTGERPHFIVRLITNTLDYEASQLAVQCARSSTTIRWSAPGFEHLTKSYVTTVIDLTSTCTTRSNAPASPPTHNSL
jgi:hypothetical protein